MLRSKCLIIIVIKNFGRSSERVTGAHARAVGALTEAETRDSTTKIEVGSVTVRERRAMWPIMRDLAHTNLIFSVKQQSCTERGGAARSIGA